MIESNCRCNNQQDHVHEFTGSVMIAEPNEDPHNHRFACVSDEAIPRGKDHVHVLRFRTDFYENHFHEFCGTTGGAIPVGNGRHVHFIKSVTSRNDDHRHVFQVATLIDNPIGD